MHSIGKLLSINDQKMGLPLQKVPKTGLKKYRGRGSNKRALTSIFYFRYVWHYIGTYLPATCLELSKDLLPLKNSVVGFDVHIYTYWNIYSMGGSSPMSHFSFFHFAFCPKKQQRVGKFSYIGDMMMITYIINLYKLIYDMTYGISAYGKYSDNNIREWGMGDNCY